MNPLIRNLTVASSILFLSVSAFAQDTPRSHGSDSSPPPEQSQRETKSVAAPASVAGTWHVAIPGGESKITCSSWKSRMRSWPANSSSPT